LSYFLSIFRPLRGNYVWVRTPKGKNIKGNEAEEKGKKRR
jgi:hypothetical protein